MRNKLTYLAFIFLGVTTKTYAGTGSADDGFILTLTLVGILLLVLGLFQGIDFIKKNGRKMLRKINSILMNKISAIKYWINRTKHDPMILKRDEDIIPIFEANNYS